MKVTGAITDISIDYQNNKPRLTLLINEKQTFNDHIDTLKDLDKLSIEIKKHREKRSLNANAYYFHLLNEIASKMRISKEELHLKYLKEHGQTTLIVLPPEVNLSGYVKYYEKYKEAVINDKSAVYYKVFMPSSEMNSLQFSVLLDGVIEDARALDIEILEDKRIEEMLEAMK